MCFCHELGASRAWRAATLSVSKAKSMQTQSYIYIACAAAALISFDMIDEQVQPLACWALGRPPARRSIYGGTGRDPAPTIFTRSTGTRWSIGQWDTGLMECAIQYYMRCSITALLVLGQHRLVVRSYGKCQGW